MMLSFLTDDEIDRRWEKLPECRRAETMSYVHKMVCLRIRVGRPLTVEQLKQFTQTHKRQALAWTRYMPPASLSEVSDV